SPSPGSPSPGLPSPGLPSPGLPSPGLPSPGSPSPGLPPSSFSRILSASSPVFPASSPCCLAMRSASAPPWF
ncbi:MAG: molybdopterin molybdenumtransferase MoeA, partial [Planctomycetaceae bacterium]|nr:molybdopterin molybdenumtransferase MoeA [Planctomycetaceae bacterium]